MHKYTTFPHHLLDRTPATVRVAFERAGGENAVLEAGRLGNINISDVLSRAIRVVGRFTERFNSDALYTLDDVRELCDGAYPLERPVDEIFVLGVRKDGVDHAAYVMTQLDRTRRGPDGFVFAEPYYRSILAVNVRVHDDGGSRPAVECELRDVTTSFLRLDPADLDDDGKLILGPYSGGNPEPRDPNYVARKRETEATRGDDAP